METLHALWRSLWVLNGQTKSFLVSMFQPGSSIKKNDQGKMNTSSLEPELKKQPSYTPVKLTALFAGPAVFFSIITFARPPELSGEALFVLGIILWMAIWWVTEAIPIPVTSLLPLILFPITGTLSMEDTAASYGDPLIFLFVGSFAIALSMEKWNLHKRVALSIISVIGTNPKMIILGFMCATAFLSLWISNTATAMMLIPISIAVAKRISSKMDIDPEKDAFPFGTALMLGVAYSATIGGLGTIIAAPANVILAATLRNLYGIEITFSQWLLFGIPIVVVLIPLLWVYLTRVAFPIKENNVPGGAEMIKQDLKGLGKMSREERLILLVFGCTAFAWVTRDFLLSSIIPGINDSMIALIAAVLLFIIPASNGGFLMDWEKAKELPWGILFLFGGGLAIASGITTSGLSDWIGQQLIGLQDYSFIIILIVVVAIILFMTEFTSNTATATMAYPIVASIAVSIGVNPIGLMVAACLAATFAFMLPVAAPPNAIAFATGYIKIKQMAKAGIWMNLFCFVFTILYIYYVLPNVWQIELFN
ncbi:SLC13 family permease [Shouchella clausii]|uniref:Sodium-dependent dicarboxylate transporter SdcS n=1 Tax=Shouchella clausii TaxID=79880 RepID=A0A268NYI2_SHOCL|nr:DASS family sodium-coupled anion symporter [Shouchella clausii]MBX0317237.1 DASS family sodium-coupled anion symporter [Shouchella clausii]PAE88546.1 anion transporter [Shouchella clausii]